MRLDINFKAETEEKARELRPATAMWARERGVNQIARLPTRLWVVWKHKGLPAARFSTQDVLCVLDDQCESGPT
jgi:hypothetical protein